MDLKNPTRTESLLANIAGYTGVPVPDMKNATRSERLLKEILDNGGGGGGDVTKEYVDNAISDAVADIDDDISALSDTVADKVDKVNGKSLSTNDYTDADKALVQDSPITVTATASPIPTANGKPRKLTIFGKSEIVDGVIKSAGESGSIEIETCGKNLFNPSVYSEFLQQDGTYKATPGLLVNINISLKSYIEKTLTFSAYLARSENYPTNMRVSAYINGELINGTFVNANTYTRSTLTITPKTKDDYIYITYTSSGGAEYIYFKDVQLEFGTSATSYEPYNATMATFTTGTPLRDIPDTTVRDVMAWNGSAGTVTKNCGEVDLGAPTWGYDATNHLFFTSLVSAPLINSAKGLPCLCSKYRGVYSDTWTGWDNFPNNSISCSCNYSTRTHLNLVIKDTSYTDATAFKTAMSGVKLVYELATPTTEPLTQTENDSLASLRTYSPQTTITINDNPDFKIKAYANTANGQAISDMQPTRSPLLTLSASGWTNNAQTVTYTHDIGKRNTIDVEPANIKAWTAAGILATAETTSTITFECDTTPTSDLLFRVTSMEVR